MKNENLPILNGGIVKAGTYAKLNDKKDVNISDRNKYYFDIIKKGLELEKIGYNFVIDTKYIDTYDILANNSSSKNSEYDNTKYHIQEKELVNILNIVNLFIPDRMLGIRKNSKNQLMLQVYSDVFKPTQLFIRNKNINTVSHITCTDPVTLKEYDIENKIKKGMFKFTFEFDNMNAGGQLSQEFYNDFKNQLQLVEKKIPNFLFLLNETLEQKQDRKEKEKQKKAGVSA